MLTCIVDSADQIKESLLSCAVIDVTFPESFDPAAHTIDASTSFLGCSLTPSQRAAIQSAGGFIVDAFPRPREVPNMDWYPTSVYSSRRLMSGARRRDPSQSLDQLIYKHVRPKHVSLLEEMSIRIHDFIVTQSLLASVRDQRVVGIMGGHAAKRGTRDYRNIVEIALRLSRAGFTIVSGGGPGAMEAANLGAFIAPAAESETDVDRIVEHALQLLGDCNDFSTGEMLNPVYLDGAQRVIEHYLGPQPEWGWHSEQVPAHHRDEHPRSSWPGLSASIPTWTYGHEPSNLFASHIAKYFENSLREDGLVSVATAGIVYSPGKAGTLQEIFADVTQNYYAYDFKPPQIPAPMIFLNREYWTRTVNVVSVLESLAADSAPTRREFLKKVVVTDTPSEVVEAVVRLG